MTTKTYSNDLRTRVIEYVKTGNSHRSAVEIFKVSKSAISSWWNRYKKEGSVRARFRGGSKGKIDQKKLKEYVRTNADKTLKEIGNEFKASDCAIHKQLKRIGLSYKKKTLGIWKQVKKKEKHTLK